MTTPRTSRSLTQLVAGAFGAVYVLVGLAGFLVDSDGFAATHGGKLLGLFEVNPLHNIAHLAIGLALLVSARTLTTARAVAGVIGAAYLLLAVVGPFIHDSHVNILALNGADDLLHLGSALVLLGVAARADRRAAVIRD
ncbi:MAG TPA: DUF4383 domain-containing protein [Mycobacteriales bacterium]|nr:DUF4383 domain-containing protein [Mycobacteriales bacterium]